MSTLCRQQVRQLDRRAIEDYGMTGAMLMENAGRGTADVLCQLGIAGAVTIVCGSGNNGGDGFVIARHLELRGYEIHLVLLAPPEKLRGDAALNYGILAKSGTAFLPIEELEAHLAKSSWAIDAVLGTGAVGEPRAAFAQAIATLNRSGVPILAVDMPSGLDCDTGAAASETIRAQHTCTFVAPKSGFLNPTAAPYLGQLHVVDIGAPRVLVTAMLREAGSAAS